jgi:GNAT superfamily N-acetyltransferase
MTVQVRPVAPTDHDEWAVLFAAYRDFYKLEPDTAVIDRVWSWIMDDAHSVGALVAEEDGRLLGIAHHREFARPSAGSTGVYLDDLYTAPTARGRGVGRALIEHLCDRAVAQGHSTVRWITSETNATARILYDRIATQTAWVTYEIATPARPVA